LNKVNFVEDLISLFEFWIQLKMGW